MHNNPIQPQKFDEAQFFARVIGVLAVLTVAIYLRAMLTGGLTAVKPLMLSGNSTGLILVVLLAVGSVALLAAWRWEWLGGVIAILCAITAAGVAASLMQNNPLFAAFIYGSPLAIAGVLFVLHGWRQQAI